MTGQLIVDLVGHLIWPVTIILLVFLLRKAISQLARSIAGSIEQRATEMVLKVGRFEYRVAMSQAQDAAAASRDLVEAQARLDTDVIMLESKTPLARIIEADSLIEQALRDLLRDAGVEVENSNFFALTALAATRDLIPKEMAITIRRLHQARQAASHRGADISSEEAREYASVALAVNKVLSTRKESLGG